MRITLDATPLLGVGTGIARYTRSLLAALAADPVEGEQLGAAAFTLRGHGRLAGALPPGVRAQGRRTPAQALQASWARSEHPALGLLGVRTDVFHATNFVLPPLGRARGVVTVHDLAFLHRPDVVDATSRRLQELVPRSLARAAAVLTPSEAVAAQVRDAYAPAVPVVAVPHGVGAQWAAAAPPDAELLRALGLPSSYLLFVGTLEPRKNLRTLLRAHALVAGAPPLVLVGARGWGEQLDTSGCLTPGYLDDEVLTRVVAGAAAVVLPSLDEGFGLPVLEALAAGTPVVASDLPVHREIGGDVTTYADPHDPQALADALEQVLREPGDTGARRRHAAGFTWERSARATRRVYAEAYSTQL